ncbi:MAG: phosphoglycerate kinase [Patescibacteria group bacterium]
MKLLKQIKDLNNKRVLVRVDFNVALDKDGQILGDEAYKISATLPTIKYLISKKAKIVLMTHIGRPKNHEKNLRTNAVAEYLAGLLKKPVKKIDAVIGPVAQKAVEALKAGEVLMLENLRFEIGEEKNDPKFAQELAKLGEVYINDGFGMAHRVAASNVAITKLLPSYAGLLLAEEIKVLTKLKSNPKKPFLVIMGGVKFETKLPVIQKLLPKAGAILLGGALANTCLKALGYGVGDSLVDNDYLAVAKKIAQNKKITLPLDFIGGDTNGGAGGYHHVIKPAKPGKLIAAPGGLLDIGPATVAEWAKLIKKSKTIVWNGPMGAFEDRPYDHGTLSIGRLVASRAKGPAYGVVGGGETVAALRRTKMQEYIDFISTGGGAMLEFLAGKRLPGIVSLK